MRNDMEERRLARCAQGAIAGGRTQWAALPAERRPAHFHSISMASNLVFPTFFKECVRAVGCQLNWPASRSAVSVFPPGSEYSTRAGETQTPRLMSVWVWRPV